MEKTEIMVKVPGIPVAQDRPHVNRRTGGVYYSKNSTGYRKALALAIKAEASKQKWRAPRGPVGVNIFAVGMRKGSDGDNLTKQILDAAVDAGVIRDDNWEAVPFHLFSARAKDKGEEAHVVIYFTVLAK